MEPGILEKTILRTNEGSRVEVKAGEEVEFLEPENYKKLEEKILYETLDSRNYNKVNKTKLKEKFQSERNSLACAITRIKKELGEPPYKIEHILRTESNKDSLYLFIKSKTKKTTYAHKEFFTKYNKE